jgi:hypothetical protein
VTVVLWLVLLFSIFPLAGLSRGSQFIDWPSAAEITMATITTRNGKDSLSLVKTIERMFIYLTTRNVWIDNTWLSIRIMKSKRKYKPITAQIPVCIQGVNTRIMAAAFN